MTTAAPPLLHVTNLGVAAARAHGAPLALLDSVALDVARGEAVAVVGESGSGKSLASRAVTGLLPEGVSVTGGTVALDGEDVLALGPLARHALRGRRLTLLLQDPFTMLHPQLTCGRQIADGLREHTGRGRAAREARRAEVARRLVEVGLDAALADRYPHELSGGMRQRVAIAAALAGDPDLLIADEPTTALDAASQRAVLDLLGRLGKDRGMGLVLVTHDLRVAFEVCDRVYVFYAGTVLEHGRPADLRTRPRHPYTAALLAAEPSVRTRREPLPALPGFVPAPGHRAPGCPFAPRCAHATDVCGTGRLALVPVPGAGEGRLSACVRIDELVRQGNVAPVTDDATGPVRDETTPAEPEGAVLALDAVSRTFPGAERPAVDAVSLSVAPGEVLALVGESGSGKTTLARIALGLESADTGAARVGGVTLAPGARPGAATRRALAAEAQIVFQDPYASLNPLRTLGATLAEALTSPAARGKGPVGRAARAAEVERLLAQVGLPTAYANRRPAALSGGERQRVAIARALATRPRLLVCDEAVAALDVSVQAQLLNLLRALQRTEGFAILFITHDLGVVRQIADRVAVMYRGGLVEEGDTARVLDTPAHAWTRRMLAALPEERDVPAPAKEAAG
ncbi:ABC transporter ATP-binding protein [Streptomyces sp. NPDC088923]|uniref:ABC transporter ATP-binding protein n=1 Tax=Streptomyces sp. NPDC088923 TaxID=3365913 RepID=UPI003829D445